MARHSDLALLLYTSSIESQVFLLRLNDRRRLRSVLGIEDRSEGRDTSGLQ